MKEIHSASPRITFKLESAYKKIRLPKLQQIIDQSPKRSISASPNKQSRVIPINTDNLIEQQQIEGTVRLSKQQTYSDRAASRQWDSRIVNEAKEIQNHLVDENIKTKYGIDDLPSKRLEVLKNSLSELLARGETDPLFGQEDNDQPIVDIDTIQFNQVVQNVIDEPQVQLDTSFTTKERNNPWQSPDISIMDAAPENHQVKIQQAPDVTASDLNEFLDGNFEILTEGQAMSELEVYTAVFDQCINLLRNDDLTTPQLTKIHETLSYCKNYFVNKIVKKGQTQKALDEATRQLDTRCITAEHDLKISLQELEIARSKTEELFRINKELEDKMVKMEIELQQANKHKLKTDSKLENAQRTINQMKADLSVAVEQVDKSQEKQLHYKQITQRLQIVADQAVFKIQVSEQRLAEEIQRTQKVEKREQFYKLDAQRKEAEVLRLNRDIDELKTQTQEQLAILDRKLQKYGDGSANNGAQLNPSIKVALQMLVKMQSQDFQESMAKKYAMDLNEIEQLKCLLQNMTNAETVADLFHKMTDPQVYTATGTSNKEVQVKIEEKPRPAMIQKIMQQQQKLAQQNSKEQIAQNASITDLLVDNNESVANDIKQSSKVSQDQVIDKSKSKQLSTEQNIDDKIHQFEADELDIVDLDVSDDTESKNPSQQVLTKEEEDAVKKQLEDQMQALTIPTAVSEEKIVMVKNPSKFLDQQRKIVLKPKEQKPPLEVVNAERKSADRKSESKRAKSNSPPNMPKKRSPLMEVANTTSSEDSQKKTDKHHKSGIKLEQLVLDKANITKSKQQLSDKPKQSVIEKSKSTSPKKFIQLEQLEMQELQTFEKYIQTEAQEESKKVSEYAPRNSEARGSQLKRTNIKLTEDVPKLDEETLILIKQSKQEKLVAQSKTKNLDEAIQFEDKINDLILQIVQHLPKDTQLRYKRQLEWIVNSKKKLTQFEELVNELVGASFPEELTLEQQKMVNRKLKEYILEHENEEEPKKEVIGINVYQPRKSEKKIKTNTVGIQVNSDADIQFYKMKVGELVRLCQEHGIIDALQFKATNEFMNDIEFDYEKPINKNQSKALQGIPGGNVSNLASMTDVISARKKKNISNNTSFVELNNVKDKEISQHENSSSLSIASYQHDDDIDPGLLKYIKQTTEDHETQTNQYLQSENTTQTELTFEELFQKSVKPAVIKKFVSISEIPNVDGIDADDELQTVPLFKQPETYVRDETIKQIKQFIYNQDNPKLQKKEFTGNMATSNYGQENSKILQYDDYDNQYEVKPESQYENFLKKIAKGSKAQKAATGMQSKSLLGNMFTYQLSQQKRQNAEQTSEMDETLQNGQKVLSTYQQREQEWKTGDIARKVLSEMKPSVKSNMPTFNSFMQQVQTEFGPQTMRKAVQLSVIDQHPRHGINSDRYLTNPLNIPSLDCIQVTHDIDKIHLKFNPDATVKNTKAVVYPCVLRLIDIKRDLTDPSSQLQQITLQQYKYEIAVQQLKIQSNGDTTVKMNDKLKELQIKLPEPPRAQSMLPVTGDRVVFIRLESITASSQNSMEVFKLLENYSKQRVQFQQFDNSTYITVPLQNVKLKTLTWTVKLARLILQQRLEATESILVQPELSFVTEQLEQQSQFAVIPKELTRIQAESLAQFCLHFASKRYGHPTLVQHLLWNLIANLAWYQFESDELYLFARFFFGDLPIDAYLTYLEAMRITSLDVNPKTNVIRPHQIMIETVPLIISSLFNNWEPKRKYALVQSVYAVWFQTRSAATIDFTSLVQLMLYSLLCFKRTAFQMSLFVFNKLQENGRMKLKQFREYAKIVVPQLQGSQINEFFYEFSQGIEEKEMEAEDFQEMFESMQLCRFAKVSAGLLEQLADTGLKQLVVSQAACFNTARQSINDLLGVIVRYQDGNNDRLGKLYKRLKRDMDVIQCDIMGYDVDGVIRGFSGVLQAVLDVLSIFKPQGCQVLIQSFMVALGGFLGSTYKVRSKDDVD
ncbi:Conserved_hypothetical protein [Hexamita inflata]|uniref:Uncharacterized protein n=1 Tax=Hexamita inflata TaxID=28002 RepID=A0ABP1K182_9EUKA